MRRLVLSVTGLLLAFLAALLALAVLLLAAAASLPPETSLGLINLAAWVGAAWGHGAGVLAWWGVLALCLAPVTVAALLGEAARARSFLWYAGATGALTAAVPALARAVLDARPQDGSLAEGRVILALFLAGVAAGAVYWLVAGRSATVA